MKTGTIKIGNENRLVTMLPDGRVALVSAVYEAAGIAEAPATFQELVETGGGQLAGALAAVAENESLPTLDAEQLDWQPPQPRPSKILGCAFNNVGIRRAAHVDPGVPNFFLKAPSSLVGYGKPVVIKEQYGHTMPEPELVVCIGQGGKDIPEAEALDHVFGYGLTDDVTSHGMKFGMDSIATTREPHLLRPEHLAWRNVRDDDDRDVYFVYHARSKSTDTFGPMGKWITTADEVDDPDNLRVEGWIDGEQFSSDTTATYTYGVAMLVAEASRYFTLEPGDLINCGTSAKGIGNFPNAHRNINYYDQECLIELEIEGLGRVKHGVVHDWDKSAG